MILLLAACLVNDDLYALRRAALRDDDGDGFGEEDCDDQDPQRFPGAPEACDGEDDDCDGIIDEDGTGTFWYIDLDGDGQGNPQGGTEACEPPGEGWVTTGEDCDDNRADSYPGAPERCDEADNNCNGAVDEEPVDPTTWYLDGDDDGYGQAETPLSACAPPAGYVEEAGDCDDNNNGAYPGAPEYCDAVDNDCDGEADEAPIASGGGDWYPDADGDGYGDGEGLTETRCEGGDGFVDNALDCDDTDVGVNPEAEEICGDGADNDCDGGPNDCTWPSEVNLTHGGSILGENDYSLYGDSAITTDLDGNGSLEIYVAGVGIQEPTTGLALSAIDIFDTIPAASVSRSTAKETIWGEAEYEGSFLMSCDLDQDGFLDLFSGHLGYEPSGLATTGEVRAWYGPTVITSGFAHDLADALLTGDANYQGVGSKLLCTPDLDGDANTDLLSFDSNSQLGPDGQGGVAILKMPRSGNSTFADSHTAILVPSDSIGDTGAYFGYNAVVFDQNADGQSDITITADNAHGGAGGAYTFFGPLSGSYTEEDADVQFYSEGGGILGIGAAVIGDTNGDGVEDIALGASQYGLGAVYIPWTDTAASIVLLTDADVKIRADVRRGFGYYVHPLGDLNQDGEADFGVAEMKYPSSDTSIFFGPFNTRGVIASSSADVHLQGDGSSDYLYSVMKNMGDWNGDGAPELMVGSYEHTGTHYLSGIIYFIPGMGL